MKTKFSWILLAFLSIIIYEVLYAWCLRYNIYCIWFLDIRISTCFISIQILGRGKSLLLDIASPDAIVRLKYSKLSSEFDAVFNMYFIDQSHSSLFDLLSRKLPLSSDRPSKGNTDKRAGISSATHKEMLLLQITTHSHLLSEPDVTQLCKALNLKRKNITCFLLQEFDTEMDFCNKLKCVSVVINLYVTGFMKSLQLHTFYIWNTAYW